MQSDDHAAGTEALIWARKTWGQLVRLPGRGVPSPTSEGREPSTKSVRSSSKDELPICAVHNLPLVKVQGKKEAFWSCHQRNPDGSWSTVKPRDHLSI